MMQKKTLIKLASILKWTKIVAKFVAIGTTITGAITALSSSSATTGVALGAAGATSYAAAKNIPVNKYEKTKHVPPVAMKMNRAVNVELSPEPSKQTSGKGTAVSKPVRTVEYVTRQSVLPGNNSAQTSSLEDDILKKKGYDD